METPEQIAFKQAEQIIYKASEQIASLKGLLKGKGEGEDSLMVIQEAKRIKEQIKKNMISFIELVNKPPYTFFDIKMRIQNSQDNAYLRWRDHKMNKMGVQVLIDAMNNPPQAKQENILSWLDNLAHFESVRLLLNRYMNYLVFLIKQHKEYLENLENIKAVLNHTQNSVRASQ